MNLETFSKPEYYTAKAKEAFEMSPTFYLINLAEHSRYKFKFRIRIRIKTRINIIFLIRSSVASFILRLRNQIKLYIPDFYSNLVLSQ